MEKHLKAALENVIEYGDTDVFPFPVENHIFFDKPKETLELLKQLHDDFVNVLKQYPPIHEMTFAAVGYNGFRVVTQIDPVWNAYLLALVISIGNDIEITRIPEDKGIVFSYRFKPDSTKKTIFNRDIGYQEFQRKSVEIARSHEFVLISDISDFYPRIYHHRLENALKKATQNTEAIKRIMLLLDRVSKGVSYGLPVGGPAARLLSELVLNRVDRLLLSNGITFCRFADDYHLFAGSQEQAYANLIFLNQKLQENEGLSLNKSKTRIMTSEEFLKTSEFAEENESEGPDDTERRQFLSLRLHYDPYSLTAEKDYEELKTQLSRFDIVGMLAREIRKTRIDQTLAKRLLGATRHIKGVGLNSAILSLVDNLHILYPVFPSVMILIKAVIDNIGADVRKKVFASIRALIDGGSYITRVPVNLAFAVRILACDTSVETDETLSRTYKETTSLIVKRDLILIMAKRNSDFWISDCRKNFQTLTPWEKRSLVIASYILEDEGVHWREQVKNELSKMDGLVMKWAAEKKNTGNWKIPI